MPTAVIRGRRHRDERVLAIIRTLAAHQRPTVQRRAGLIQGVTTSPLGCLLWLHVVMPLGMGAEAPRQAAHMQAPCTPLARRRQGTTGMTVETEANGIAIGSLVRTTYEFSWHLHVDGVLALLAFGLVLAFAAAFNLTCLALLGGLGCLQPLVEPLLVRSLDVIASF